MLRKKHTRCDRIVTLEFVPVSSVWTPQHSPQRPTQGIRRPGSNLFSAVHHRIDWPNLFLLLLAVRIWYAYRLKLFKQSTYISYMCLLAVFSLFFHSPLLQSRSRPFTMPATAHMTWPHRPREPLPSLHSALRQKKQNNRNSVYSDCLKNKTKTRHKQK